MTEWRETDGVGWLMPVGRGGHQGIFSPSVVSFTACSQTLTTRGLGCGVALFTNPRCADTIEVAA